MNALIQELRDSDQDFEFYPTTDEIIAVVAKDINSQREANYRYGHDRLSSLLDIGSGSGKVLLAIEKACDFRKIYAIEKAIPLCSRLVPKIFIIGTEFHEQSLVSKAIDVTFCNPPYSEFKEWAVKIIRESASKLVYLVIPKRWKDSVEIADAIDYRNADVTTLGEFSFENAEDRKARAIVNVLRIELSQQTDDAFDRFFDKQFADLKSKFGTREEKSAGTAKVSSAETQDHRFKSLVVGANYPETMVSLYNSELDHISKNYDLVAQLDVDLLKEFDVTPARILECLKARMAGLRNDFWKELFRNMKQVTNRLTSKKRGMLLDTLNENGHVDFTLDNIHAIIIWILKNANQYLDDQIVETFDKMIGKANVKNYVSNQRVFEYDHWRYNEDIPTHIALEYRIVLERMGGIETKWSTKHLSETACDFLGDLMTISHNLGFSCTCHPSLNHWDDNVWDSGVVHNFEMAGEYKVGQKIVWLDKTKDTVTGKVKLDEGGYQYQVAGEWIHERYMPSETLFEVRAYYNRNMHIRLNQKFALALNVEYGRLKGWLKSAQEAADELNDKMAAKYFNTAVRLGTHTLPMLGAPKEDIQTSPPDELRLEFEAAM